MNLVLGNWRLLTAGLLAGLCGGFAEIGWIAAYSSTSSTSAADVARGITATVLFAATDWTWAPWAGVGIHLALSLAVGLAFVLSLWSLSSGRPGKERIWVSAVSALVTIWTVNFLLILPALNSALISLMPYGATLLSKTLFGVAMAWTLTRTAP